MTVTRTTPTTNRSTTSTGNESATHTVAKGDTMSKIANQNNVSLKDLIESNPQIKDPSLIKPGQDINLPAKTQTSANATHASTHESAGAASVANAETAANALASNIASDALRRNLMPNYQPQNLDEVRASNAQLIKGSRGPAVEKLQTLLNKNGANLATDGIFGPKTEAALMGYQQSRGLTAAGILDSGTLKKLEANPSASEENSATAPRTTSSSKGVLPNTSEMTTDQKFDYYANVIEQNGGRINNKPDKRNLLALRVETDADINGGKGAYDDRMVMLWQDENGTKHVREYKANTEPSAQYRNRYGEDADGDGKKDQGRLMAGSYEYQIGHSSTLGKVMRPTESTIAERDTNHDGLFNDNAFASAGKSMLIHSGGTSNTGSAGCQTMSPGEYDRFWSDLNASGGPGKVGYTLVNLD